MADRMNVRAAAVNEQMHSQFRRRAALAAQLFAVQAGNDQVVRLQQSFVHARGRRENTVCVQTYRNISIGRGNESAFAQPLAGKANIAPMFGLGLEHS